MSCARLFAVALGLAATVTAASADADRLTSTDWVQIKASYDAVLADPSRDTERLTSATILKIHAAYDAPLAGPSVDEFTASTWASIRGAYTSHDPDWIEVAARAAE